jgi:hypothetical protein
VTCPDDADDAGLLLVPPALLLLVLLLELQAAASRPATASAMTAEARLRALVTLMALLRGW